MEILRKQSEENEVIVIVDEPSEEIKKEILNNKELTGNNVVFILNKYRVGKVNALNEAIKFCNGKILLFLDGDVELPDDPNFISNLCKDIEGFDALEIKKVIVRNSFLAKIIYYDYASLNIYSWLSFRSLKKVITLNGAAFAIRKEVLEKLGGFKRVVTEDIDLALRLFFNGYKVKFSERLFVYCYTHSSLKAWFFQRLRWAIGGAELIKTYKKELIFWFIRNPEIFFPYLVFLFPSFFSLVFYPLVPNSFIYGFVSTLLLLIANLPQQTTLSLLIVPYFHFSTLVEIFKALISATISTITFVTIFFFSSKKLNYDFSALEFFIYYFIYSFLSFFVMVIGLIQVLIFDNKKCFDWKV